jgi:hypothetical protein
MTGIELLEKYPLTAQIVRDWFMKSMLESFKDENVPEEFKQFMLEQGIENDKVSKLIDVNVRILFDVFDENEIFIGTHVVQKSGFHYTINNSLAPGGAHYTRKKAEHAAIEKAFEILEEKLTPIDLPKLEE